MSRVLLVCGSREWTNEDRMAHWLERGRRSGLSALVHGGARGADDMAGRLGTSLGFEVRAYPVDVSVDGPWPAAGVRRNARMLEAERAGLYGVLAFTTRGPRCGMTKGTADMFERCIRAGLAVTVVPQDAPPA